MTHLSMLRRSLALMLVLMLLCAAHAEIALINSTGARVYADPSLKGKSAAVKKFTPVELLSVSGNAAKIRANGYTVYIDARKLTAMTDEPVEMVFSRDCRVYALPNTSSKSAKVTAGTRVNVLLCANGISLIEKDGVCAYAASENLEKAVSFTNCETEVVVKNASLTVYSAPYSYGKVLTTLKKNAHMLMTGSSQSWARLEANGVTGYCALSGVEEAKPAKMTAEEIFANEKLSTAQKVYYYIVNEMNLNSAAACGIMANIDRECSFNCTELYGSSGAYGLCQWLGGRKNNLFAFCEEGGYDSASLEGQCRFMKYELENKYKSVWKYMQSVENTPDGAYDAGYYWCYYYEIPENRAANSDKRGILARDTYWPKYH